MSELMSANPSVTNQAHNEPARTNLQVRSGRRFKRRALPGLVASMFLLALPAATLAATHDTDASRYRAWVEEMKEAPRGPFKRIRWFCNDGTILPPKAYACREHDGGHQHGEWSDRTEEMRARGYFIANVLAGSDPAELIAADDFLERYGALLLEQFLISVDDGWIYRQAQFYRGALQVEDERVATNALLLALLEREDWLEQRYLPLREGARLLAHGEETASLTEVRQLSATLADKDPAFKSLRNKIHGKPEAADADRVREYRQSAGDASLVEDFDRLAELIDEVFGAKPVAETLVDFADGLPTDHPLGADLRNAATVLGESPETLVQLETIGKVMVALREQLSALPRPALRLAALDLSIALEVEHFAVSAEGRESLAALSRRDQLDRLPSGLDSLYGAGLLSEREHRAQLESLARLREDSLALNIYKEELDYLGRIPGWSLQRLEFHFSESLARFRAIEPLIELYVQDRVRGSALLDHTLVLDRLLQDANRLGGVTHQYLGEKIGTGFRALNPGIARGILQLAPTGELDAFDPDGIYVLPETTAELPPIAGILTAGEGNPLSHVQLLARNLGIPNVAVGPELIAKVQDLVGKRIVLAVSPGGSVKLAEDSPTWDATFGSEEKGAVLIKPDLVKLDLGVRDVLPLESLRADDSGRTVGPKAAKLGELKHIYPDAVADGLAVPFGVFRGLLDAPAPEGSGTVFEWMVARYEELDGLPLGSEAWRTAAEEFRERLYQWILTVDAGDDFRSDLRQTLEQRFGKDGTYGVFVRSDTNVEDLPGFTGAGLNLTLPNVVGVDAIVAAVPRVWASPFTQRAFAWRQSYMNDPEHVYPAVLLLESVPAEKSGVMVTRDIQTGADGWLSVAVNEGVGGAVDGQAAESLLINVDSGQTRLLAQASARTRRLVLSSGGIDEVPVSGSDSVLSPAEIDQLRQLAAGLRERFPNLRDSEGNPAPADVEFGFLDGKLKLFQIRPFLESALARSSGYLNEMDQALRGTAAIRVDLQRPPGEG